MSHRAATTAHEAADCDNDAVAQRPGLHFLIPFIYKATKSEFTEIKENEIGLIESVDGSPIPAGRIFAAVVAGHIKIVPDVLVAGGGSAGDGLMGIVTKLLPGIDIPALLKKPGTPEPKGP